MNVSTVEPSAAPAGESPSVSSEAIQNYVTAVDNYLLDVPWRRRRELIADLQEHLRENSDQITVEQPQDYAAELRAAAGAVPGGLLSGLRSASWPTPLQWWESAVRGGAIVLVTLVAWELLATSGRIDLGTSVGISSPSASRLATSRPDLLPAGIYPHRTVDHRGVPRPVTAWAPDPATPKLCQPCHYARTARVRSHAVDWLIPRCRKPSPRRRCDNGCGDSPAISGRTVRDRRTPLPL